MKDDQNDNYQKTIYVIAIDDGFSLKVKEVVTSKKKVWEYLQEFAPMFRVIESTYDMVGKEIMGYSAFCKYLIPFPVKFKTGTSTEVTFTVTTWKV